MAVIELQTDAFAKAVALIDEYKRLLVGVYDIPALRKRRLDEADTVRAQLVTLQGEVNRLCQLAEQAGPILAKYKEVYDFAATYDYWDDVRVGDLHAVLGIVTPH